MVINILFFTCDGHADSDINVDETERLISSHSIMD